MNTYLLINSLSFVEWMLLISLAIRIAMMAADTVLYFIYGCFDLKKKDMTSLAAHHMKKKKTFVRTECIKMIAAMTHTHAHTHTHIQKKVKSFN